MSLRVQEIPAAAIVPSPHNPRQLREGDPGIASLAESIRAQGLIQPITVRPRDQVEGGAAGYEIVAGERRWRACRLAGLEAVPAIVRTDLDDQQALELIVTENLQREDLQPLEEARGYQQLLQLPGHDVARVAERMGRSVAYIYDRLKLLSLIEQAQQLLANGRITLGHAILLARLKPSEQKLAIEKGLFVHEQRLWDPTEDEGGVGLFHEQKKPVSVRELQGWIDEHVKFDPQAVDPILMPETAATVAEASEAAEKIVPITHDHFVQPDARDGARVIGPRSWKRADGHGKARTCEHSVLGVFVVGPGRGKTLRVCIEKKRCKVHWAEEQREAAKRAKERTTSTASGSDRWARDEERRKADQAKRAANEQRFKKALPAILEVLVASLQAGGTSALEPVGRLVVDAVGDYFGSNDYGLAQAGLKKSVRNLVLPGETPDDLVRHLAFLLILDRATEPDVESLQNLVKPLKVDVKALLATVGDTVEKSPAKKPGGKRKAG